MTDAFLVTDVARVRRLATLALRALIVVIVGGFVLAALVVSNVLPADSLELLLWLGVVSALYWLVLIRAIGRVTEHFDIGQSRLATNIGLAGIVLGLLGFVVKTLALDAAASWVYLAADVAFLVWNLLAARLLHRDSVSPSNLWLRSAIAGVSAAASSLAQLIAPSLATPLALLALSVFWFLFGLSRMEVDDGPSERGGGAVTALENAAREAAAHRG